MPKTSLYVMGTAVAVLAGVHALRGDGAPLRAQTACPAAELPATPGVMSHVRYLSDDALEGREVGSRGAVCTTEYLAARFEELGLEPSADGWFQSFPVRVGAVVDRPGALAISNDPELDGKTWTPFGFSGSGRVSGALRYVGPGVARPGSSEDRFARMDIDGSVAVVEARYPGVRGVAADPHFKATVLAGRSAGAVVVLLPDDVPLPDVSSEQRPFLEVPVVAVRGEAAARVREAAEQGASARLETWLSPRVADARNVVGIIAGADPDLAEEYVIVGAHHDHLGFGGEGSMAPGRRAIHNGADDNASGTAALVEIARALREGPAPARSVLFIAFAAEERGLLGSAHYVEHPLVPLERTVAMINLDMVGRLGSDPLTVSGVATAAEWSDLLEDVNGDLQRPLRLSPRPDGFGASDHASFFGRGIPVLHLFTGTHGEYHRPSDDWPLIDAAGLGRVVDFATATVRRVSGAGERAPAELTPVPSAAPAEERPTRRGYGPYLGSIPDMTPRDFGVRLNGVNEGSPAEAAGLRAGDVVIELGGHEITDLYAYTYALRAHEPGDEVDVVVLRDGERVTLGVVLGER